MSRNLRRKIIVIILMALFAINADKVHASHAMGADLTYQCLGGNTYRITLSFYRDCIGIAAPGNVYINATSASCGRNLGVTCYPIPGTGQEVTPICPAATSTCNGGVFTGIQEWVYQGVINLPAQCTDWVFSYNLCCRNAAITTITTPGSNTFYLYATLNNVITPCNSSPTFSNKPVPFVCLGQQFCFNHGAYDPDGDSLVYSLITPFQTATTTVNYTGGYNANNPLNSVPATSFNTATGDICMTPQQLQVTVMAVLIKEYRNGVLIGSVERDLQVTVLNCTNTNPSLTGINGTGNFSATICAGQPYCFFINSIDPDVGQNVNISWNGAIPGATFTIAPGTRPVGTFCWTPSQADISGIPYCFTVRVWDDACPYVGSQTYSYCITVTGVQVNAGPDQVIACNDLATISATASGGSPPYTYLWSNGSTAPAQTVGTGTYIVTVSDGSCSASDTVVVANTNIPTAAFTPYGGCINDPLQFTDQSIVPGGVITSWNWNFGDGTIDSIQNPVHQYGGPGVYNVQLIITTSLGCIDTAVQTVNIIPQPVAAFTPPTGCAGLTVSFTDQSTPSSSVNAWYWDFGNGSTSNAQNPTTTYPAPGTYNVMLIAGDSSGCSDTVSHQVTINPLPVPDFTFSNPCATTTISFTDNSTGANSWSWNLGNGSTSNVQNPSTTYPGPGTYTVTLVTGNSFGCSDSISKTITIDPPPVANAGPDVPVCQGSAVVLNASGGVTYVWSTGATTSSISVAPGANTTYTVTVTDANGCTATDMVNVTFNPLPIANAGPDASLCAGSQAVLTASGGVSYTWFPSGDTTATISVSPGSTTTYAVTVIDANGCQATDFVDVVVHTPPVLNLQNSFLCSGFTTTLNAGNPGAVYAWSTGATTQTISVSAAGTYTVLVTDQYGCTASGSSQITVGNAVVLNLGNIAFCLGDSAVIDAGHAGSTYQWSNGATTQTITVNASGAYGVTVTDPNGCTGNIAVTVNVNSLPQPNFLSVTTCIGNTTQFTDATVINSGTITGWSWNFGDGNFSQQQNPSNTYNAAGTYTVILTVTSSDGCTASISRDVDVIPLPNADFQAGNSCLYQAVSFSDLSGTLVGNITGWSWTFGDGGTSALQNPTHQYGAPGNYMVTLQVTTAGGCVDTITRPVVIYPVPVAGFTAANVCVNSQASFTNTSSVSGNNITSSFWDFGDGTTSTTVSPNHTYSAAGTFQVTLIVTTAYGCIDTVKQPITIYPLPNADAGANQTICNGSLITLTATGGTTYSWSPGGAVTSSINVSPASTTTYTVLVTDANGCQRNDSVRVSVNTLPLASAGPDKAVCAGLSTSLTATGGSSYLWSNGATASTITVTPPSTTNYVVTVTNANGCTAKDTVRVTVNPLPAANAGPDQAICNGTTATLTASGGTSYYWTPGGSTANTIYVNPSSTTMYQVVVTDANGCQKADSVQLTINPVPVVNLSNSFVCAGFSVTLDAGNPGCTWLWSPNGETTQTISVSAAGTYGVLVTNPQGCAVYASCNVSVGGNIFTNPANFSICAGEQAVLDAGNPGFTYLWSTGATSQTISTGIAGAYTVTVTDPNGCTGIIVSNVVVNPIPVAAFTPSPACNGSAVMIANQSTVSSGNIMSYAWNFGDGILSAAQQPSHIYQNPGAYNITLIITSGSGCLDTVTHPVTVYPLPVAAFTSSNVCLNNATSFTDQSGVSTGTITSWNWSFGDGTTSSTQHPFHTYLNPGAYNVTLVVTSSGGCTDTTIQTIEVYPKPVADFRGSNVCNELLTQFTNASSISGGVITNYQWNFGDGFNAVVSDPSHLYANAGIYQVTLIVTSAFGCKDTAVHTIEVYPLPTADFITSPVCQADMMNFSDKSIVSNGNITDFYWSFGDGGSSSLQNPSHLYQVAGTYQVRLVITTDLGCMDTIVKPVTIYPMPAAAIGAPNSCIDAPVQFTDLSTNPTCAVTTWRWDFGDGGTSSLQNPSHPYNAPGTYQVTLIVSNCNGCSDTITTSVNVWPLPVAGFGAAEMCLYNASQFSNYSSVPGGGSCTYLWDFGDGDTSSAINPSHTYTASGTYMVSLTVYSAYGCASTVTHAVNVLAPPAAAFSANDVCYKTDAQFIDHSNPNGGGGIVGWLWDFGDGSHTSVKNPTHNYNAPGTYGVSLTVLNAYGCSDTYLDSIRIFVNPEPRILINDDCFGSSQIFTNSNATIDGFTSWLWSFGDGQMGGDSVASHTYLQPGVFQVMLETTNQFGCKGTVYQNVTVYPLPNPDFTAGEACAGEPMYFNNSSSIGSGTISGYEWYFGDGSAMSTTTDPSHIYNAPGSYQVTLIAISDHGCIDSVTYTVIVNALPVVAFSDNFAAGCGPVPVSFTDLSTVPGGVITGWYWDFGDGGSSLEQNPTHVYSQSGVFSVTLTVTSDKGCISTLTQYNTITIYPSPGADFNPTPAETNILEPDISFDNLSTGAVSYFWTFGDGGSSNAFEPTHTYGDTGTFTVMLAVVNVFGCVDTVYKTVHIKPVFHMYIPNAFTPNQDGVNDHFYVAGEGIIAANICIFNRWGERIYQTNNNTRGWDGTIKDGQKVAQQDVYVYDIIVTDVFGQKHHEYGRVNLVR